MSQKSLTLDQTKAILDSVSPTYCGAKWTQVLFQFHLGSLHNCCLTPAQPIDKKALFNSPRLIQERQDFLDGKKIKDCAVCWKAEDKGYQSDRVYKSSEPWTQPLYDSPQKLQTKDIVPSYIELSLSNRCQFKCAYCSPENSSSLYAEAKTFGPYRLKNDFNGADYLERSSNYFLENDDNPYVDAFIAWYPTIAKEVKNLRFTGGEPLLSHRLFEILDLL
ncbi:MAG: radical SAM protein, partial [Bdellovibrionales bacterium]|nr:radical SAM protein [Bdellovibrionales bacterium]